MTSVVLIVKKQKAVADFWLKTLEEAGHTAYSCNTSETDVAQAIDSHRPAILFIEASFASNRGFEIARRASQLHPALRSIVCFPAYAAYYTAAIQTDVSGYLPDDVEDPEEVFACVKAIHQGYRYISPVFHRALYLPSRHDNRHVDTLTMKQKQILRLVAEGYTSRQIGQELGIAQSTVQNHKEHISKVVGLKGVYQLKIFAGSVAHLL